MRIGIALPGFGLGVANRALPPGWSVSVTTGALLVSVPASVTPTFTGGELEIRIGAASLTSDIVVMDVPAGDYAVTVDGQAAGTVHVYPAGSTVTYGGETVTHNGETVYHEAL